MEANLNFIPIPHFPLLLRCPSYRGKTTVDLPQYRRQLRAIIELPPVIEPLVLHTGLFIRPREGLTQAIHGLRPAGVAFGDVFPGYRAR